MLRNLLLLALIVFLMSCAKVSKPDLTPAESIVNQAYEIEASKYAPSEYQAAYIALSDARRAIEVADYDLARSSAEVAVQHGQRAIMLTENAKAQEAQEEIRQAIKDRQLDETEKPSPPAAKKVRKESKQVSPPPPPKKPAAEPKPLKEYIVGEGENLWMIAAHPQVYKEGLLWPLLYQANRDQIKDPRQIFPGQVLSIRRDMTEEEQEEAREKARASDIFPMAPVFPLTQ